MRVASAVATPAVESSGWLFSRSTDLWAFGAPAVASLLLVAVGFRLGIAHGDLPPGLWLAAVLGIDVAHVWSSAYRVYTDPAEVRRRPVLYLGAPLATYAVGVVLHAVGGPALFWRVLAYAAVFHFVRQQYGWVRMYRRAAGERDRVGGWIDGAAIYASTICPLLIWHARLPRHFHWFVPGDFAAIIPPGMAKLAAVVEAVLLTAYALNALRTVERTCWGKHLVVASTAVCWWVGIVTFDSDYIFSVTNVLLHGVPYLVLIRRYGARRYEREPGGMGALFRGPAVAFYVLLVLAALGEEGLWDNLVWHDHPQFFGDAGLELGSWALTLVVPLLAVPQGVHYLLDAFIWRVGPQNPQLAGYLRAG